ncbi:MAG: metal dependent phosphohydrolase [Candidatus Gottesmanbacteria bacterium GW2011_GWA2_43_14]|uniref:Metal dependent phosphohydrolase n=1 Tax=Candidatus Gottesmanbacteria bacterium GW2011_GWA2_43_14 TaxID=1618443 RepID=A0A0G1DCQ4_9BACT|nr:MAG: metal dependent phosphohydrolase [Candidatus Gottesmanbacteria bacterium GW2011_GWA2_43_14]
MLNNENLKLQPEHRFYYRDFLHQNATEDVFEVRNNLLQTVAAYLPDITDVNKIAYAFDMAYFFHKEAKQFRGTETGKDGRKQKKGQFQEYMVHPGHVALILADAGCDVETIEAALLHDTREDTDISDELILDKFGKNVFRSVENVTKITGLTKKKIAESLTLSKLINAFDDDPRSILIKLADRLHNMRTIYGLSHSAQSGFVRETLNTFVPMARLVHLNDWADEMSDIAAEVLWPDQAAIAKKIIEDRYRPEFLDFMRVDLSISEEELFIKPMNIHNFIIVTDDGVTVKDPDSREVNIVARSNHQYARILDYFQKRLQNQDLNAVSENGITYFKYPYGDMELLFSIFDINSYLKKGASLLSLYQLPDVSRFNLTEAEEFMETYAKLQEYAREQLAKPQERLRLTRRGERENQPGEGQAAQTATEFLNFVREGLPIITYTPEGEIIVLTEGSTAWDFAFTLSGDLGLLAESALINGEPRPMESVLSEYDKVRILPGEKWTVSVTTYKNVKESRKGYVRKKLREVLKFSEKYGQSIRELVMKMGYATLTEMFKKFEESGESLDLEVIGIIARKTPPYVVNTMGYESMDELETMAEKVRLDAEDLGEEILLDLYKNLFPGLHLHKYGKLPGLIRTAPIVDLNRGWDLMPMTFKKKYCLRDEKGMVTGPDFQKFIIDSGLGSVNKSELRMYIKNVWQYEDELPGRYYELPDEPGVFSKLDSLAVFFANIVDITVEPNKKGVSAGMVGVNIKFETTDTHDKADLIEMWDFIVHFIKNRNKYKDPGLVSLDMNIPEGIPLEPFIALLEAVGITVDEMKWADEIHARRIFTFSRVEKSESQNRISKMELKALFAVLKNSYRFTAGI